MTFLAFQSADIFNGDAVHLASFYIVMKFLVNAVKLIAAAVAVIKVHLSIAVAIDTPAHA